jgi:hypothetical protein
MPETEVKELTPEQIEQRNIDRITAGVTAGVAAAMPKITASVERPVTETPAPRIETNNLSRPSEEDVAEAMVSGNKAEVTRLLKAQRAFDQNENRVALGNLSSQGSAAIGSLAKQAAERLPRYRKYKSEIDQMVEGYVKNTGAVPDFAMYERAHQIVSGQHIDDILSEDREETLRKAREPEEPLLPEGGRRGAPAEPAEPTSLAEALAGDWSRDPFVRAKRNATHGRTDEEELRHMGFKGGLPDFLKTRKELDALNDQSGGAGGFNLDRDWDKKTGTWVN